MSEEKTLHLTDAHVSDYADGLVDVAATSEIERHLASCARCRAELEETHTVVAMAQRMRTGVKAPSELWPLVAASTIHLAAVRRQALASLRGVLIIGALALVAATAFVTWNVARWTRPPHAVGTSVGASDANASARTHPTGTAPQAPQPPKAPRP